MNSNWKMSRVRNIRSRVLPMVLGVILLTGGTAPAPVLAGLPAADPATVGMDAARLARIDEALQRAIDNKVVPGAVALIGRGDRIVHAKVVGQRAVEPSAEPMTRDTIFDMASLTKPVAAATSVMILLERGKLRLNDRLGRLLPEFDNHGKGAISVEQLLRHRSGLIPDNAIGDYANGPEEAWKRLAEIDLQHAPGERFVYSDLNFIILGRIVEKISGQPLDEFALEHIYRPLGMADTRFLPESGETPEDYAKRTAPTERDGDRMLRAVVHDPRSRALGGVAGHAGLFSTADDLAILAATLLDGGRAPNGHQLLSPLTVRAMTSAGDEPADQRRGLGWDIDTGYSSPRGVLFGPESYGHTGFTGTSLWIDPETRTFVILLTSRLHPNGKKSSPIALRREIATLAAAAILDADPRPESPEPRAPRAASTDGPALRPVKCGVDMLIQRNFEGLHGKRVGLVTNHTGRTRDGKSTIDVLFQAPEVKLVALFSPEHGIRGLVDKEVGDSQDEKTGLPIHSLYGKNRKPTPEALQGIDVLVYDIQDVGVRFYTYISTLGLVLEAAGEQEVAVMVLDRPNPIGGVEVGGPVRDDDQASFIAYHELPVRHGMTVGELARMFNAERKLKADLTVIPCEGWHRSDLFDRTGLLWVNPSPNMRSLTEALAYPGVGLLEATNLATGRGTDTPFERIGATWIDPVAFSNALNQSGLEGIRFTPIRFSPTERQFKGEDCGGVYLMITDRSRFDPIQLGITMAVTLRRLYPKDWKPDSLLRFLCDRSSYDAIVAGEPLLEVEAIWADELEAFRQRREKFLIYR